MVQMQVIARGIDELQRFFNHKLNPTQLEHYLSQLPQWFDCDWDWDVGFSLQFPVPCGKGKFPLSIRLVFCKTSHPGRWCGLPSSTPATETVLLATIQLFWRMIREMQWGGQKLINLSWLKILHA